MSLGLSGSMGLSAQQVPRQGRLGPRQTARVFGDWSSRDRRFPARQTRPPDLGRRRLPRRPRWTRQGSARSLTCCDGIGPIWRPVRVHGRPPLASGARAGQRAVSRNAPMKSISNETTFGEDTGDPDILDGHLWRMAEKVSDRAKAKGLAGRVVTLKLKRHDHSLLSRRVSLRDPAQLADTIYRTARSLFDQVGDEGPYRLLGCGLSDFAMLLTRKHPATCWTPTPSSAVRLNVPQTPSETDLVTVPSSRAAPCAEPIPRPAEGASVRSSRFRR